MECQHCKKDGISVVSKSVMLFGLRIRCHKCGTLFKLHRGVGFLLAVAIELVVMLSVFWAFKNLSPGLLWLSFSIGMLFLLAISVSLPLKKESQLTRL